MPHTVLCGLRSERAVVHTQDADTLDAEMAAYMAARDTAPKTEE